MNPATSTPLAPGPSTNMRASLGNNVNLTPLRRDRRAEKDNALPALDESCDEIERAERRRSVALRRSILTAPLSSNKSSLINDSLRVLSEEDLKTQLQTFCKLHAENKISVKNAWSIRVIDVLKQIVTKNNPDMLKFAGNSLEIAGKVYGLRVDDMHSEGLKLAGNLMRNFTSQQQENENEENHDPNTEETEPKTKKREKKKKHKFTSGEKHTVNRNRKAFLAPLPKAESVTFSVKNDPTLSATGNLFTNKLTTDTSGNKFMLTSQETAWPWTKGNDPIVGKESNTQFPIQKKSVKNYFLCAAFKDFQVDLWDADQQNKSSFGANMLDDVVFDANGFPIAGLDGSIHDVFAERDDDAMGAESLHEEEFNPLSHGQIEHIVDFRPTEQSLACNTEKSAYSFNTVISTGSGKIDQIWAGPNHWKLKFLRRNPIIYSGQDRDDLHQNKKKPMKKKKEMVLLDFRNMEPKHDLSKVCKKPARNTTLDPEKLTIPLLDLSCVKLLENIEYMSVVPTIKTVKKKPDMEVEYSVPGYNYNNPNDSNYCPQQDMGADDNDADILNDCGNVSGQEEQLIGFTGNNLIEAPEMIEQNYMQFATRAKKMDMKKLKQRVWCCLTRKPEFDLSAKVTEMYFSEMYAELKKTLPEKMRGELSVPIAFVALLHLCNEQNLILVKQDISDVKIKGAVL